jgi:hypothetical protein
MLKCLTELEISDLAREHGLFDPALLALGCALSPLPYIPYIVLRKCRRAVCSKLRAHIERDLSHSVISDGDAVDGFSLDRRFRLGALSLLRSRRLADASTVHELTKLRAIHAQSAQLLSPLLVVEAELAWDYVLLNDIEFAAQVEKRLRDVLYSAICEVPPRTGILTWVSGARDRLPAECIQGEAAWLLSQLCRLEGLELAPVKIPSDVSAEGLVKLFVDRLPSVVIGLSRKPGYIEFGPPSPERSVGLTVLDTDPIIIFAHDPASGEGVTLPKRLALPRGEAMRVECTNGEILLRTLAGQTFTLARMIGKESFEARVANRVIHNAIAAKNTVRKLKATVIRSIEAGYVVFLPDIGATAFMVSPKQELFEGESVTTVVDRVFQDRRWISVKRVSDQKELAFRPRSTLLHVPSFMMPTTVRNGDSFHAVLFKHGSRIYGNRRSAHVFLDQRSPLGNTSFGWKPGRLRFHKAIHRHGDEWLPPVGTVMEVYVAGLYDDHWELRLRTPSVVENDDLERPLEKGNTVDGTVVSVEQEGAELEAPSGQMMWLPRLHCYPLPAKGQPIALSPGKVVTVRLIGYSDARTSRLLASQRALVGPHLLKLKVGDTVLGIVVDRLTTGEFQILADPIPRVSMQHFRVATVGEAGKYFSAGDRVSSRVNQVLTKRWLVLVSEVEKI